MTRASERTKVPAGNNDLAGCAGFEFKAATLGDWGQRGLDDQLAPDAIRFQPHQAGQFSVWRSVRPFSKS
jgi:hypothetical protein